jgi:flagellar basal-body rod protein FlgB
LASLEARIFILCGANSLAGHDFGAPDSQQAGPHGTQVADKAEHGVWPRGCTRRHVAVDAITNSIERYMDLLSARQKLVVSNLANIDTPGYKSKDIDFQFEFISLAQGQSPNVVDTPGLVIKSDGNNVSLDRETRLLSETALRFNVASNLIKAQLKIVESAIKEGQSG